MGAGLGAGLGLLAGIVGRGLATHAGIQLQQKQLETQNQFALLNEIIKNHPDYLTPDTVKGYSKIVGPETAQLLQGIGQHAQAAKQHLASFQVGGGAQNMPGFPAPTGGAAATAAGNGAGVTPASATGGGAAPAAAAPTPRISQAGSAATRAQAEATRAMNEVTALQSDPAYDPTDKLWLAKEKQLQTYAQQVQARADRLQNHEDELAHQEQARQDAFARQQESQDFRRSMVAMQEGFARSMKEMGQGIAGAAREQTLNLAKDKASNEMLMQLSTHSNALAARLNTPKAGYDQATREKDAEAHNKFVDQIFARAKKSGMDLGDPAPYKLTVDPATKGWNLGPLGTTAGTPGAVELGGSAEPDIPPPPPGFKPVK